MGPPPFRFATGPHGWRARARLRNGNNTGSVLQHLLPPHVWFVNIGVSTATQGNLYLSAEGVGQHAARPKWSLKIGIRLTNLSPVLSAKGTSSAGMLDKKSSDILQEQNQKLG